MNKKILKISIVGKTNAGKSTLINSLVGETISIINRKINTTEDSIIGIINQNNVQIIIYDTPGLNFIKNINNKNSKLKRNLWEGINNSDYILYLLDVKKYNIKEIENNIKILRELKKRIIFIFNKNDLVNKIEILPKIKEVSLVTKIDEIFDISAKKKTGIKNLLSYLIKNSYFNEWIYKNNEISNKDDIFITNECTRNAVLSVLHKEIPYNVKIINQLFKYLKNGDLKIKQDIEIDNSRYKKIIIGRNGNKIKDIRVNSQNAISKILKTKTHLYIKLIYKNDKKI